MRARRRLHLAAGGWFIAVALLMTWPLALNFGTAVPGNGYDSWQNMWNLWHFKEALLNGHNPFTTTRLYHPSGISLYLHTLNPLNFLISLPVHALFGLIAAYNFVVLVSIGASGYAAYLLGLEVTGSHWPALVGGTVFATSGYLLAQVLGGHTHMMAAQFLPLAVLGLLRAYRLPGRRSVFLAGVLLALNALCDWQYFLFALLFAAWYGLVVLATTRRLRPVYPIVLAVAVACLLVLPLAIPTALLAARTPTAATEGGELFRIQNALDVVDLVTPSQLHPLWGTLAEQIQSYKAWQELQNKTGYLGAVSLALAVVALRRRQSWFWWATAGVFALLSLGPRLQIGGAISSIPLPAALLYRVPLVNISRYPMRFVVITMLALAVLAALGSRQLADWATRRRPAPARPLVYAALLGLLLLDHATLPLPLMRIYIPPPYAELAGDTESYGIFEAPLSYRTSAAYLLYQTVHARPIVGGYTSRVQPYPLLDEIPLLQWFATAQTGADIIAQPPEVIAASVFSYFDIRYLLLHSAGGALRDSELERLARAAAQADPETFGESVLARDAPTASRLPRVWGDVPFEPPSDVLLYRLAAPERAVPFLGLGAGWSPLDTGPAGPSRRIETAAELAVYSAQPRRVVLTISLSSSGGSIDVAAGEQPATTIPLDSGDQRISMPLAVAAGRTPIRLSLAGGDPIDVRAVDLREQPE